MAAPEAFPDLRRITLANKEIVDIAATLLGVANQVEDANTNATLRRTVERLLNVSGQINDAAANVARVTR
jgi:hypothetical protein